MSEKCLTFTEGKYMYMLPVNQKIFHLVDYTHEYIQDKLTSGKLPSSAIVLNSASSTSSIKSSSSYVSMLAVSFQRYVFTSFVLFFFIFHNAFEPCQYEEEMYHKWRKESLQLVISHMILTVFYHFCFHRKHAKLRVWSNWCSSFTKLLKGMPMLVCLKIIWPLSKRSQPTR